MHKNELRKKNNEIDEGDMSYEDALKMIKHVLYFITGETLLFIIITYLIRNEINRPGVSVNNYNMRMLVGAIIVGDFILEFTAQIYMIILFKVFEFATQAGFFLNIVCSLFDWLVSAIEIMEVQRLIKFQKDH